MLQSHIEVLLEDCLDSHCQFRESKGEVMSKLVQWASKLMPCLPHSQQHEVQPMDDLHLLAGRPHVPHRCRLDVLGPLETQLSCHPTIDSAPQGLETLQWLPVCTEAGCTSTEIRACLPTRCLDVSQCTLLVQPTDHVSMAGAFIAASRI